MIPLLAIIIFMMNFFSSLIPREGELHFVCRNTARTIVQRPPSGEAPPQAVKGAYYRKKDK